jgi:hypothetical protein
MRVDCRPQAKLLLSDDWSGPRESELGFIVGSCASDGFPDAV